MQQSTPGDPSETCPHCGLTTAVSLCEEPGCGRRFFPQPGYHRARCPVHDPELLQPGIPASFREYKLDEALRCPRCGERVLGG